MTRLRRSTTCRLPGHGTGREVAQEKATHWPRTTERRLALEFEESAGLAIPLCELPTWDGPCALHTGHPQPCIPVADERAADVR